jgi:recombination protein RecA
MKSASVSRLESLLQARRLDGTLTRTWLPEAGVSAIPSGVAAVDRALGGGWRRGEVSELIGPRSSGRTTVLLSTLAAATADEGVVGLVDAVDRFDPASASEAGVDLNRVLWVRGPALTVESARPDSLDRAVHQAIRAVDLIVRAGGFSVVALDMADVPPRHVRALPWTTWLRLAHTNEGRDTVCLLVGDAPMGKSARGASVRLAATPRWTGTSAQSRRFVSLDIHVVAGATRAARSHDLLSRV